MNKKKIEEEIRIMRTERESPYVRTYHLIEALEAILEDESVKEEIRPKVRELWSWDIAHDRTAVMFVYEDERNKTLRYCWGDGSQPSETNLVSLLSPMPTHGKGA